MKTIATFFLLLSGIVAGPTLTFAKTVAGVQNPPQNSSLSHQMYLALKQANISSQSIGAIVTDTTHTVYQLNSHKLFIPASLIKIFTAGALLELLSPSLTWTTQFMSNAPIENNTLKGPLYLKGGGDPGFVSESLWNLVNNLTRTRLKTIEGPLIVDDSRFDQKTRGPRLKHPSSLSYDALVSALSFNWNTANIYFRPGDKVGAPLHVTLDPSSLYWTSIKNQTVTAAPNIKKRLWTQRKKAVDQRESLIVKGKMPLGSKETLIYQNILYPSLWTGWNAHSFLKQRGIAIKKEVKKGKVPQNSVVLAQWQGLPLADQVKLMMKYSNNFMVEMLVKNMAIELTDKTVLSSHFHGKDNLDAENKLSGKNKLRRKNKHSEKDNLKVGIKIIKSYLQKKGILEKEYTLVQPSGLSRQNRVKPWQILRFLKAWLNHPLQPEFLSTFPLSGEDGTLKKYFSHPDLKTRVRAKTASLNGVIGLAGYLTPKTGNTKIFVFIFNGPLKEQKKAKTLFQTWLTTLSH